MNRFSVLSTIIKNLVHNDENMAQRVCCYSINITPVPHMLQNNLVYKITCPGCNASYVGQTSRLLQQRFREHVGSRGLIKNHFDLCKITPTEDHVEILGKNKGEKLWTLEALFINKIKPTLNSKDEYRSRTLKLKF